MHTAMCLLSVEATPLHRSWGRTSGGKRRQVRQLTILRQVIIGSSE